MPVHVYGNPCNVDEIEVIAKKHNLKVIYDVSHALELNAIVEVRQTTFIST